MLTLRCCLDKQGVELAFNSSHAHLSGCSTGKVELICLSLPSQLHFHIRKQILVLEELTRDWFRQMNLGWSLVQWFCSGGNLACHGLFQSGSSRTAETTGLV